MSGDKLPIVEQLEELRWEVPGNSYPAQKPKPCDVAQEAATTITELVSALEKAREALWTFGQPETIEQLYEDDEEWAKFRFLVKDYKRAEKAIAQIDTALSNTRGDTREQS